MVDQLWVSKFFQETGAHLQFPQCSMFLNLCTYQISLSDFISSYSFIYKKLYIPQWPHEHFIQAKRISTIFWNHIIRVDDIPSTFTHFVGTGIQTDIWIILQHIMISNFCNLAEVKADSNQTLTFYHTKRIANTCTRPDLICRYFFLVAINQTWVWVCRNPSAFAISISSILNLLQHLLGAVKIMDEHMDILAQSSVTYFSKYQSLIYQALEGLFSGDNAHVIQNLQNTI